MNDAENAWEESDAVADERVSPEAADVHGSQTNVPIDAAHERRRRRIFDHRVDAQDDPDTMIACLAGVNSDLMDTELVVAEKLRQGLSENGVSLETIERHAELINLMLRLSKQIAQITQLEHRSRKKGGEATSIRPSGG